MSQFNIRSSPYNAVGNGIADDTAAIRAAIAAAQVAGGVLVIPAGRYLVNEASASEIFLIEKPFDIAGEGMSTSMILVKSTVPATTDVFRLSNPYGPDYFRGFHWSGFSIQPQSGHPARYGLNIDVTANSIAYGTWNQVEIGQFGDYSIHTTCPSSFSLGKEFYLSAFYDCVSGGGVDFTGISDSIRWLGGVITGARGIVLDQVWDSGDSAHGFLMHGTNVTCANGITVLAGNCAQFKALDMESTQPTGQANRAMIDLQGRSGAPLINVCVTDSFLGAGAVTGGVPNVDITVRVGYAIKTELGPNMVGSAAPPALMYHNTSDARTTRVAFDWNVSGAQLESALLDEGTGTVIDWIPNGSVYFMQAHHAGSHKAARANMTMIEAGHEQFADQPLWGVYGNDPGSPLATLAATPGALSVGGYRYRVAYIISGVERAAGSVSGAAHVAVPATAGQIALSQIAVSDDPLCTARVIYRSKHDGLVYFYHSTIANNTATTLTDNTADTGLGTQYSMLNGSGVLKPTAGTPAGLAPGAGHLRVMGNGNVIVGKGTDAGPPFQVAGSAYFKGAVTALNAFNLLANAQLIVKDSAGTSIGGIQANTSGDYFRVGFQSPAALNGYLDLYEDGNFGARLSSSGFELQSGYGIAIGAGTRISKHLSATKTWDPASITPGAQTTTTITVTGAALGDTVAVGFSLGLQTMQLTGYVDSANTVVVVLRNGSAFSIDLGSGTLRADVWQH